jgi:hypothetical protein
MTKSYEDVAFKTLDGIRLRGYLYAASRKGPAVILTPGVSAAQYPFILSASRIFFTRRPTETAIVANDYSSTASRKISTPDSANVFKKLG